MEKNYKELYEQAMEVAQRFYNNSVAITKKGLADIFPELKESEDEKIKEDIKRAILVALDYSYFDKETADNCLAYLEKQAEQKSYASETMNEKGDFDNGFTKMMEKKQKPTDKVEPKPAWSEEDEQYLLVCKNALAKYQVTDKWDAHIIFHWLENKLKSLRPQNRWKPSDEQMEVLLSEVTAWTKGCPKQIVLESLYNDLKKLK